MKEQQLTENALVLLRKRYFKKDRDQRVCEDWSGLCNRVVSHILLKDKHADQYYKPFFDMLHSREFLPNSPTLFNAGFKKGTLSACFYFQPEDDMWDIKMVDAHAAMVQKFGGGVGFNFSKLRPRNAIVSTTNGKSSGPIAFMQMYSDSGRTITQSGKRDAAMLGLMSINHPDIEQYIAYKRKEGTLSNFNISVALTNEFMEAVEQKKDFNLVFEGNVYKTLKASELMKLIINGAWRNGEPGILFMDTISKYDSLRDVLPITGSNPCGEQVLENYSACNLGSIDLSKMLIQNETEIDWAKLKSVTELSVRFLDDVIDVNSYPVDRITKTVQKGRKIGLGIMGWADLLYKLKIRYGSEESINLAKQVMGFIQFQALLYSIKLAQEKEKFPLFDRADYSFIAKYEDIVIEVSNLRTKINLNWLDLYKKIQKYGLRNATVTTIAPTGSLSIIANCSGGIEPNFALSFKKNVIGKTLNVFNPIADQYFKEYNISDEALQKVKEGDYVKDIEEMPSVLKEFMVTSSEVSVEEHIKMQAAFQSYTSNAISKTINFANEATPSNVGRAIMLAYKMGCKGLTIYREGSRNIQVYEKGNKETKDDVPEYLPAKRIKIDTPDGVAMLIISVENNYPREIYFFPPDRMKILLKDWSVNVAICRCLAVALQGRRDLEDYINQLKKALRYGLNSDKNLQRAVECLEIHKDVNKLIKECIEGREALHMSSLYKVIAMGLDEHHYSLLDYTEALQEIVEEYGSISSVTSYLVRSLKKLIELLNEDNGGEMIQLKQVCPECGEPMYLAEGCMRCYNYNCQYAKCG